MNELLSDHARHDARDSSAPRQSSVAPRTATTTTTPPQSGGKGVHAFSPMPVVADGRASLTSMTRATVSDDTAGHHTVTMATGGKASAPGAAAPHASGAGHDATATLSLPRALDPMPLARTPDHDAAPDEQPASSATLRPIVEGIFVRQAALRTTPSSSSFHVVLQPRALGLVTVHVERNEAGLQVTLAPRLAETQALLDKHLPDLIAQLRAGVDDGSATHVSIVAPGQHGLGEGQITPPTAGQGSAPLAGHGGLADSGARQPFDGRGAAPEHGSDESGTAPIVTPTPAAGIEIRRASFSRAAGYGTARIDVRA